MVLFDRASRALRVNPPPATRGPTRKGRGGAQETGAGQRHECRCRQVGGFGAARCGRNTVTATVKTNTKAAKPTGVKPKTTTAGDIPGQRRGATAARTRSKSTAAGT